MSYALGTPAGGYRSRKFVLAVWVMVLASMSLLAGSAALFTDHLTGGEFVTLVSTVLALKSLTSGAYLAANVADHKLKGKGNR